MKSASMAMLLFTVSAALAASYDPYQDRANLRKAASASYDAASRAAGLPLAPEKAADIKSSLDESVADADLASNTAKSMETDAGHRADEMAGELKGRGAPAPADAVQTLSDATTAQRARWKTLSSDHDALAAQIAALPDKTPEKSGLTNELGRAAADETAADAALTQAEAAAPAAAAAVAQMKETESRARRSADERSAASAEISQLDGALPAAVADAKSAVDLLGQEPQAANRTRAGQKLAVPRDLTGQLYSAADRACNRADDYRQRSAAFEKAQAAYDAAQPAGAAAEAKAQAALDDAGATQADVRARLSRVKTQ